MPLKDHEKIKPLRFKSKNELLSFLEEIDKDKGLRVGMFSFDKRGNTYFSSDIAKLSNEEKEKLGKLCDHSRLLQLLEYINHNKKLDAIPVCPMSRKPILIPVLFDNNGISEWCEYFSLMKRNGEYQSELVLLETPQFNDALEDILWLMHLENKAVLSTNLLNLSELISSEIKSVQERKVVLDNISKNRSADEIKQYNAECLNAINTEEKSILRSNDTKTILFIMGLEVLFVALIATTAAIGILVVPAAGFLAGFGAALGFFAVTGGILAKGIFKLSDWRNAKDAENLLTITDRRQKHKAVMHHLKSVVTPDIKIPQLNTVKNKYEEKSKKLRKLDEENTRKLPISPARKLNPPSITSVSVLKKSPSIEPIENKEDDESLDETSDSDTKPLLKK